ncbi:hypothetical protein J3E68DRAFT_429260 [Trichoderma sp. SZMC 28012]
MANPVQENGIQVVGTTNSRGFDFSRYEIVDRYWREDSSVRILMKDVTGATDRAMICSRGWEVDYPQLDKLYGNMQHTIQAVTEAIGAWCKAIIGLVRDEENWKWKNEMIRKVDKAGGEIRLWVKIYQAESPSVVWSEEDLGFVLFIPEANVMDLPNLVSGFKNQLLSAFDSDELYHIPKVQYVEVPSELLLKPPYYLTIQATPTCISVQSSHSPSLKFLAEYLWEHESSNEEPPVIDIKLHQNPFTPKESAIYDNLTLRDDHLPGGSVNRISPLMLVRLVENELGYKMDSRNPNSWYFCRKEPLEELLGEPLEEPPEAL